MVTAAMKLKSLVAWKKDHDPLRQHIKKQRHYFANKVLSSQSFGFYSGHVWMRELDHKEDWARNNWCFWAAVLRKLLRVPWTATRSNQSTLKKSTLNIHWKDWCYSWSFNNLTTWCKEPAHWKIPWWRRRRRQQKMRCLDGKIESMTWVWTNSGR